VATKEEMAVYRKKLKEKTLARYGTSCAVCGFDDTRALQIDHVNGGGNAERIAAGGSIRFAGWNFYQWLKVNGYPDGYQTLCANCNMIKHEESKNMPS
jgi:hypothetical protein